MIKNSSPQQVKKVLARSKSLLAASHIESARLDAEIIVSHILGKPRTWILAHPGHKVTEVQINKIDILTKKRALHIPTAYLTNNKEFYGRNFFVNKHVLVPRPESEDLIELALNNLPKTNVKAVDLGTGSGNLGVTLACKRPDWIISLADVEQSALEVAKKNAENHNVLGKLLIQKSNLLPNNQQFDLIIANLPYVPDSFNKNKDLKSEPKIALFAGDDGLVTYRKLFDQLKAANSKPRYLLTESLHNQHQTMSKLALEADYRQKKSQGLAQFFLLSPK